MMRSNGNDGFVSLEVSPYLAMDTKGTIAEAERLWKDVKRQNLMVKVPATPEGLPAIEQLIGEGISVNITLLFSQEVYREVAEAYIAGLEKYVAKGGDPAHVASVACFFVSRIDTAVDKQLDDKIAKANDPSEKERLSALKGKVAIANAKLAYQDYKRLFAGARWEKLAAKGAKPQRLLWASTGTKNKDYSDVLYVEELIGPNTVNTVPPATLDAFRDHGSRATASRRISRTPGACWRSSKSPASRSTLSPTNWSGTASSCLRMPPTSSTARSPRSARLRSVAASIASSSRSATASGRPWMTAPRIGAQRQRSDACGRRTNRSGPATTKTNGWAG